MQETSAGRAVSNLVLDIARERIDNVSVVDSSTVVDFSTK